jgi:LemA protein
MNELYILGAVILVGLIAIAIVVGMYNNLITLRNRFKNAFAQIDVQLKRRYDLIPNLVETAKAYLKHESHTLEAVVAARNSAAAANGRVSANPGDANAMQGLIGAETALAGSMTRFFAIAEAYPELKANTTMMQLSEELSSTENKVAFSRQAFNDSVMQYNTARETFPSVVIAHMFNFQPATPVELQNAVEREAPKVSFG